MSAKPRWRLIPRFLLRRAGFPFEVIEQLACPQTAALAEQCIRAQDEAGRARTTLLRERFPEEVKRVAALGDKASLKALSQWRRKVGQGSAGEPPEGPWSEALREAFSGWRARVEALDALHATLAQTLSREEPEAAARLRELVLRPDVREAVFLLVPALLEAIDGMKATALLDRRAAERALERRLYAFVQRLGSKNETTSFFGPLTHAQVDPAVTDFSFGPELPGGFVRREVFAAFWAVTTFASAIAADPEIRRALPVRRIPASRWSAAAAFGPDGKPAELPVDARALLAFIDDRRTLAELAALAGLPVPDAERALTRLERTGFVRRDLEPLSTVHYPLTDLRERLPEVPGAQRWKDALDGFAELLRKFEKAPLEARRQLLPAAEAHFEKAVGKSARRGAGQMYADRTVLFEDCEGDLQPVRFPAVEAARLEEAMSPALDLGAAYGRVRFRALRTLAGRVLAELGQGPVPFLTFAAALDGQIAGGALDALDGPGERFLERLTAVVEAASDGHLARLSPSTLTARVTEGVGDGGIRFASPDVMLERGANGQVRFVIGEVHPYVFAWGSQNHFAPDAAALQAEFRKELRPWGGAERMAVVLRRRRHKGLVADTFPGTFIEVTGKATHDDGRRVAIADLRVVAGEDGPELCGPNGPLTLYVGEDDHPHLRAFAPPLVEIPQIRLGAHTPRIEVGELVYQRERWELAQGGIEALCKAEPGVSLSLEVTRARLERGWPRFVFISAEAEPKPLCLDLDAPLAQAHLQRLLATGPLTVIEMVPDPRHLWLCRTSGAHTSELRLGMIREA
jgi:hypothetical protein